MAFSPLDFLGVGAQFLLNRDSASYNASKQLSMSKQLFDYQNEYNSPVNQVKRLQAAGISPWVMNGNSQIASMPSAPSSSNTPPDVASIISARANRDLAGAQADSVRADTQRQNDMFDFLLDEIREKIRGLRLENNFNERTLDNRIEQVAETLQLTKDNGERVKQDLIQNAQVYPKVLAQMDQELQNLKKKYELDDEDLKKRQHETRIASFEADIKKVSADIANRFGITSDADGLKAIVQAIISGHGPEVIEALKNGIMQTGTSVVDDLKSGLQYIKDWRDKRQNVIRGAGTGPAAGGMKAW